MGHRIRRGEPGNIGHSRMRTQVEEHTFADHPPRAAIVELHLDRPRSDEAAFTHDPFYSGVRGALGMELMFLFRHLAFALRNNDKTGALTDYNEEHSTIRTCGGCVSGLQAKFRMPVERSLRRNR
jgi:hypothetical protein